MKILIYIFLLFQVFCVESIPISMTSELLRQIRAENISFSDAEIIWESYDTSTILLFLLLQVQYTENITYSDTESTGGIEKNIIEPVDGYGFELPVENITEPVDGYGFELPAENITEPVDALV